VKRKNKDGGQRQTFWNPLLVGRLVLGGRAPEEEQKINKACEKKE
jgi:hypothetical protein